MYALIVCALCDLLCSKLVQSAGSIKLQLCMKLFFRLSWWVTASLTSPIRVTMMKSAMFSLPNITTVRSWEWREPSSLAWSVLWPAKGATLTSNLPHTRWVFKEGHSSVVYDCIKMFLISDSCDGQNCAWLISGSRWFMQRGIIHIFHVDLRERFMWIHLFIFRFLWRLKQQGHSLISDAL